MQIRFTVRNLEKVKSFMASLPRGVKIAAMEAFSTYIIGNEQHGLKHEPADKFVSRAAAYGKVSDAPEGYFSWKQFRYVAWLTDGFTKKYQRTHDMQNAWNLETKDSNWTQVHITNDSPGSGWVFGEQQARQPGLVGWRKYADVVASNMAGAMRAAQQAVDRWLKSFK